ncbi:hypothetical protein PAF17_14395 [Paracoccus sp. Z330]|uniref:Sulfotransferase domain-containing protein n=1 Tax=Paracoccus onchidii TaxID=3017813 RepID=A0ABT4ZH94_9RHOB|nr:hypothetical protein [Paracoccus onchidii]MDB6178686.1 hypothetical protein [Paracoccus onchidii]
MLYIHIGTQKTGSSSIQHVLHMNEPALKKHGYTYLRTGRKESNGLRIHHNPIAAALLANDSAPLQRKLHKEITRKRTGTAILSGELLSRPKVAAKLRRFLPPSIADQIKIIIYLRRPDLYVESLFKQRLKADDTRQDALQFLRNTRDGLMHEKIIDEYAKHFGSENIIIRPYDRAHLVNENAVDDFLHVIGMPDTTNIIRPAHNANTSFSLAFSQMSGYAVRHLGLKAPAITRAVQAQNPDGIFRSRDVYKLRRRRNIVSYHNDTIEKIRSVYRPDLDQLFDTSDLAAGADDPFPTSAEQITLMQDAAQAMMQIIPHLSPPSKKSARTKLRLPRL